MYAVCRVFEYYGRIDPADQWLPEFRCFDELVIEDEANSKVVEMVLNAPRTEGANAVFRAVRSA
jgi:hypothetical protein